MGNAIAKETKEEWIQKLQNHEKYEIQSILAKAPKQIKNNENK